jgi:hypothetical protein
VVSGIRGVRELWRCVIANERMFAERRAWERPLTEHGVLRRRAVGLIAIGTGFIAIGITNRDVFHVTVGLIGVVASGAWRWIL